MLPALSLAASPSTGTIESEGVRGFMLTTWGVLAPAMLASGALFAFRRKLQPIRGRGPYLVLCGLAVCLSYVCFICAQWVFPPRGYSCAVVLTFGAIHNSALCVVYVWRCLRLWFKARVADEMAQEQSLKRHRRTQSPYAFANRRGASTASPVRSRHLTLETGGGAEEGVRSLNSPASGERSVAEPKSVASSMLQMQALSNVYDAVPPGHSEVDSGSDTEEFSRPQSHSVHLPVPPQLPPVPVDSISRGGRSNSFNAAGRSSPSAQAPGPSAPAHAHHPSGPPPVRILVDKPSAAARSSSPLRTPTARRVPSGVPLTTAQRMAAELQLLDGGGESGLASGGSSARTSPRGSPRASVTNQRRSVLFSVTANSFSKRSADGDGPSFWFLRHRFLDRNPAVFAELLLAFALFVVIPLVAIFSVYSLPTDEPICTFVPVRYFSILTAVIAAAAFITIGMQLRRVNESFFIKREMTVGGTGVVAAVVLYAVALFGLNSFSHNSFPLHYLAALIAIVALWSTSVLWPLYRSFDCSRPPPPAPTQHKEEPELECTLEQVLEDPVGIELFSEHLRSEFSLENLVFWESVEDFRALAEDPELEEAGRRDLASQVFEACIEPGAYFEVNLPHGIKLPLLNKFRALRVPAAPKDGDPRITFSAVTASQPSGQELVPTPSLGSLQGSEGELARVRGHSISRRSKLEPPPPPPVNPDLFDVAQRSIFRLMESDSFVRFCSTPEYRKFVSDYYAPPAVTRPFQTSAGAGQLQYGNARESSPSPSRDHVAPLPNDRFFELGGSLRNAVSPGFELPAVTVSSLTSPSSSDSSSFSPSSSKPSLHSPSTHLASAFAVPLVTVEDRSTSVSTSVSVHGESARLLPSLPLGALPPAALPVSAASILNGPIPSGGPLSPGGGRMAMAAPGGVRRNLSLLQKQGSFTSLSSAESIGSRTPRGLDREALAALAQGAGRPQSSPYLEDQHS